MSASERSNWPEQTAFRQRVFVCYPALSVKTCVTFWTFLVMHCKWGLCTSDSRSKKSSITFWPFPKPCKDFRLLQKEPSLLAIEHNPLNCSQCSKCLHWIKACKVESLTQLEQIDKNCYVCSKHFQESGPTSEQPCPFMAGSADRVSTEQLL